MTSGERRVYDLITLTAVVFFLFGAVAWLAIPAFEDYRDSIPEQIRFVSVWGRLLALQGMLCGGAYMVLHERSDHTLNHVRWFGVLNAVWLIMLLATFVQGLSTNVEWAVVVSGGLGIAYLLIIVSSVPRWEPYIIVWFAGMTAYCIWAILPRGFIDHFRIIHITLTPATVGLGYWLMYRYSTITRLWGDLAVKVVTGWLVVAGILLVIDLNVWTALYFDDVGWNDICIYLAAAFVFIAHIVTSAHAHHALTHPNETRSLAAYWHAFVIILRLGGIGVLGATLILPQFSGSVVSRMMPIILAQIAEFAVIAMALAVMNWAAADLRPDKRRVTGLLPYWCILGGWLLAILASVGTMLMALSGSGWSNIGPDALGGHHFFGMTIAFIGSLLYLLGFFARGPSFEDGLGKLVERYLFGMFVAFVGSFL